MNISNKLLNIFHCTLSMFLHYLGKFNNSNLLQILKRMQTKNDFLHTLSFSAHNLYTYYLL